MGVMGPAISHSDHSTNVFPGKWRGRWVPTLKLTAGAFLRIFTVLMSCMIVLMVWESSGSAAPFFTGNSSGQKIVNFRVGDNERASALWNSAEQLHEAGERLPEPDELQLLRNFDLESQTARELGTGIPRLPVSQGASEEQPSGGREVTVDHPRPTATISKIATDTNSTTEFGSAESDEADRSLSALTNFTGEVTSEESYGASPANWTAGKDNVGVDRCDFTIGEWVEDIKRHYYSGKECKAFLDQGFACRLTNRPNFDYEKFRWQPEGCDLPRFSSDDFLERMRNKVVAFVGDSLGRQQFQSLMCMLTAGEPDGRIEEVQTAWGPGVKWAYRFRPTNTTIVFYWSAPLCDIEEDHPDEKKGHAAMHLDRPPVFLKKYFYQIHVLVLNTGHHWNRQKWEAHKWHPYLNGKPLRDKKLAGVAECMNLTVHKVVEWVDTQLASIDESQSHKPVVFVRTLSPRHFQNGEWNTGGTCDNTQYVPKTVVQAPTRPYRGPVTPLIAEIAVKGTRLNLLNITHLSKLRSEGHISKYGIGKDYSHQDCLHWCLPGIPDVWNEVLYGELHSHPSFSFS